MRLQIKSYFGRLIFEAEAESLRDLILGAVKSRANLRSADLSGADLSGANLRSANLSVANLSVANLSVADLSRANLSGTNLSVANLRSADLSGANLSGANLRSADLRSANLSGANLSGANLSGTIGLPDTAEWFRARFKRTSRGVIVYKCFNGSYPPNPTWAIRAGAKIAENCNPSPFDDCGCGVNFATLEWVKREHPGARVWRCLIPWAWLTGVVVPVNSDGKARCSKLILLREEK